MKFEFKGKRVGKGLALVGTLALCLVLTGCYIPPDEIAAGTTNMTVGSNNLPFDTFAPATDIPTQVPTQAPTDAPSQPTINWDDWGTNVTTNTPNPNMGGTGTIVVVTQQPTNTPNPNVPTATPASSSLKNGSTGTEVRQVQQRLKELCSVKHRESVALEQCGYGIHLHVKTDIRLVASVELHCICV